MKDRLINGIVLIHKDGNSYITLKDYSWLIYPRCYRQSKELCTFKEFEHLEKWSIKYIPQGLL